MVKQSIFMLALFAIAFLAISFASANLILTNTSTLTANVEQGNSVYFDFKVNNTNDIPVLVSFENSTALGITSALPTAFTLANNTTSDSLRVTFYTDISTSVGERTIALTAKGNDSNSSTLTFKINVTKSPLTEICGISYTSTNVTFDDVDDEEKGNEDAWAWRPLDDIELTVNNIANNVDKDVKFDVSVVFYQDGKKVSDSNIADDEDSLTLENLKINGEDEEDATLSFQVSGDVDEGNYDAYVKVKGSTGCFAKKVASVSIEKEANNVIVKDVQGPVSSGCGETVELSVDISNIGSEDEDQVKVSLYNRDLGLNLYKEVENLDEGDSATVLFSFVVPQNAQEKLHRIVFSTEFEYDDDDEEYDSESDSDDDFTYSLNLLGNCVDPTKPTVTAKLNSTAVVGQDLVVEVTLKNNGNTSISAIIAPEEYDSWAEFIKVDPATVSVGRLESKKVYITFKPTEAGQQTFNLNVIYNGKSIDQPVTLTVDKNTSLMDTMYAQLGKTGTYLVIAITLLVVLILLVLVVRLILSRNH